MLHEVSRDPPGGPPGKVNRGAAAKRPRAAPKFSCTTFTSNCISSNLISNQDTRALGRECTADSVKDVGVGKKKEKKENQEVEMVTGSGLPETCRPGANAAFCP